MAERPNIRVPATVPARGQKITKPVPLAAELAKETAGGEDFDDPTQASPVPAQVARSMKAPQPVEKPNVIRRNTPLAVPELTRPPTAQPASPMSPEPPAVLAMKPGQIQLADIASTGPAASAPPLHREGRLALIGAAAIAIAGFAALLAALLT